MKQVNDVQICIRLPRALHDRLVAYSMKYGLSVSRIIRLALMLWFFKRVDNEDTSPIF